MNKGKLMVYGCGGCGTELTKAVMDLPEQTGLADVGFCFIDTSRSNLDDTIGDELFVKVTPDDKDGSGKIRKTNLGDIRSVAPTIPVKFKPGDVSVVIFSGAGGSGSVIGPIVAAEIQKHTENPVICIVVGSAESGMDIKNTIDTLMSLDGLARLTSKKPMLISFEYNGDGSGTNQVDQNVQLTIGQLLVLANKTHRGLDTADLTVWADFPRASTCSLEPQLALLNIYGTFEELKELEYPISICSISAEKTLAGSLGADYNCYGLFTTEIPGNIKELHFATSVGQVGKLVTMLRTQQAKLEDKAKSRPAPQSVFAGAGKGDSDDDGMVM